MSGFRLTRQADSDLEDIWDYIANHSPEAADGLLDTLYEKFELLARQPSLGQSRDRLRAGMRVVPAGKYVIYFEPDDNGIVVIRVLNGARDHESLFPEEQ
jgi:toxin ParE1/3/4